MKNLAMLVLVFGLGNAFAQSPFVDVPPCHWANEAIGDIAGTPEVSLEQARTSPYLAVNALQQVFEGLKCGNLAWSAAFMREVPAGTAPQGTLSAFTLEEQGVTLSGDTASLSFRLNAVIDGQSYAREGSVSLVFDDARWKVVYPSLAALELPIFP